MIAWAVSLAAQPGARTSMRGRGRSDRVSPTHAVLRHRTRRTAVATAMQLWKEETPPVGVERMKNCIIKELENLPAGKVDESLYDPRVKFQDPLNDFIGIAKYANNIRFLAESFVFSGLEFDLHSIQVRKRQDGVWVIDTAWTLAMTARPVPWKPRLLFTGTTCYVLDEANEYRIREHIDTWDAIQNQRPVSAEAVQLVAGMIADASGRWKNDPDDAVRPFFKITRQTKEYEIRNYSEPFTTADVEYEKRPEGLSQLDLYFAGENELKVRIPRTVPLLLEFPEGFNGKKKMCGVLPPVAQVKNPPKPNFPWITLRKRSLGKVAVITFDGSLTPDIAQQKRSALEVALKRDDIHVSDKNCVILAQYTPIFTLPWRRKNEVWLYVD